MKNNNLDPTVTISGNGQLIMHEYADVEKNVFFDLGQSKDSAITVGYRSKIKYGSALRTYNGSINIGQRSSIGEYTILAGHGGIYIGDLVIISGHCYIAASEHIYSGNIAIRFQGETARGVKIEDGVWIGANCTILDGVKIGSNSIIGAGSVVTKDMPSGFVCFGVPCKPIKKIKGEVQCML